MSVIFYRGKRRRMFGFKFVGFILNGYIEEGEFVK